VNSQRLDPALDGVLLLAREKREQQGGAGDGTLVVRNLSAEQALALDGMLAVLQRRRPVLPGTTLRLRLSQFEAALRACSVDPRAEYERVGEGPLRDLPAERVSARDARDDFRGWLATHELVQTRPALGEWLERATGQGRIHAAMRPLVDAALRVLSALPAAQPVQRTVLAARLLEGDPHGLDVGTPLHSLVVALLIAGGGLDPDTSPRTAWASCNVLVDPISSNAITLGLPLLGDGSAARLVRAAAGRHVVLTHGQLAADALVWPAGVACFTCENPSVVIAAEQALEGQCAPLLCTGGHPSDAVRLLLGAIADAGGAIRHHGDFDDAGLLIMRDLHERYGTVPWRFDRPGLERALARAGDSDILPTATSLPEAVAGLTRAIPEELLLDELLVDLRTE